MVSKRWRMAIGCDAAGLAYKELILADLQADDRVQSVRDLGVPASDPESESYGEVGIRLAELVAAGEIDRGVLICGTGIGMAISANKVPGVRATVAHDSFSAERSILSNNCQVLTLGQRVIGPELARRLVKEWLGYEFDSSSPSNEKVVVITRYEDRSAS
ncbi:RpiB/LacA/LacB family sugar-phosphate isomerase [Nonomuraea basaltis]|uniref:RpiB/LacA/LacB family sugar-phosphate isomerase n=1 Tax=Nonomuraea basaltis TaxID=2495887 RepID=UPI00110C48E2|nr:RpiB/LacA/LacB family sugar-phosphate isomerase [Nonomuraea basaltis]TMR96899.1 RpiB/LacA/LacB family sugar-phosphate isomerase [Nonomuraea basaltis]